MTNLAHVVGHAAMLERLARAGSDGLLSHAILFTGPESVGKTTAALALAGVLLDGERWPGGARSHPDLWVEDSDVENISIERIRPGGRDAPTLQDFLLLRPYAGGRRVAVLARADRLTEQAANALLKTVEEPPPRTHLLLATAHPEALPPTVLSRCEREVCAPLRAESIHTWLTMAHGIAEEQARLVAPLSAGRPGRALALAQDGDALAAELAALDLFLSAGGGGVAAALRAAASLAPASGAAGRERALVTLAAWAGFVRDAACYAVGAPELALWAMYRPALERWAEDLPAPRIVAILDRVLLAAEAVATYAQPRLALEALLVDIFAGPEGPPAVPSRAGAPALPQGRRTSAGAAAEKPRRPQGSARARSRVGG